MASRFLTDKYEELVATLHPSDFLVGRIRHRTLSLECVSPRKGSGSWQRSGLPISGLPPLREYDLLPLPPLKRQATPFLLLWPSEWCIGALVELPSSVTSSEREAAISALLEPLLPWPIEEAVMAYDLDTAPQGRSSSVYAWSSPLKPLQDVLSVLQGEGFDPRWVFPESLFLSRILSSETVQTPFSGHLCGLIDGDRARTHCLLVQGNHIKGETAILHDDTDGLSLREHRLADHLLCVLSAGQSPETFYRTSDLPSSPLVDRLSLPLPPSSQKPDPSGIDGWKLIRTLSRDRQIALSFRKGNLSWQGDMAEQKSGFRILGALTALLVLVLILDAGVHLSRMDHRIGRARAALDQAATQALPGHRIVEPVTQLKQEILALDRQKNLLSRGPDIIRIMKDLTAAPPNGVPFELVSLNVSKRFFTVSGKTDSFKSVDRIKKALSSAGHMKKLAILSAGLDIDRKTVTFRIRGRHD